MNHGRVLWLTGLSGSGKTTLALALDEFLQRKGVATSVIDGDEIRKTLCKDLGYTAEDRTENQRRIAGLARKQADLDLTVIVATISPRFKHRVLAEEIIHPIDFYEIYLATPLEECERRDPKGMYAKARRGEISAFTGVTDPYEEPEHPDVKIPPSFSLREALQAIERSVRFTIL